MNDARAKQKAQQQIQNITANENKTKHTYKNHELDSKTEKVLIKHLMLIADWLQ